MPHTYFVADRDQTIAANGLGRRDFALPEDGVVFCSFNQNYKIEPSAFAAWMRILAAVPGSVLWLSPTNANAEANLRREAAERGIAPERLIFAGRVATKSDHLERLALADIALDTLAYNGHTTTSDALGRASPSSHRGLPFRLAGQRQSAQGSGARRARRRRRRGDVETAVLPPGPR